MCTGASTAVERDLCNAPRVAPSASHNNCTVAATRCATQRVHAGLTRAAPHSHAQGDGSKQLKGTATAISQGAQARTATLIHLPLVEVALALVQRGALAMAHAHRSAAAEHGERCSHHLLFAAAAPHPRNRRQATKGENKLSSRHGTHSRHNALAPSPQQHRKQRNKRTTAHSNSTAASTVASSAVALHNATARCAAARHAAQWFDRPCGRRSSFSTATQHSTSFESAPHWQCSNTQAAWLVRHLSHLRFLTPPTTTQIDGQCDGHGGAWSLSLRVTSVRPCWRVACASSEAI
ncbi:hypothetical protein ERJ75_001511800 [Trypanosoma vivax]|nr:hypothetical protein ERJ75_001798900 [Trypanosoma vivax]KAH8606473.1 hypothetical protein ERJ75_001511800 [Trypanosoma vivax]